MIRFPDDYPVIESLFSGGALRRGVGEGDVWSLFLDHVDLSMTTSESQCLAHKGRARWG
jgi:hypothetical protein